MQRKTVINNTASANVKLIAISATTPDLARMVTQKEIAKLTGRSAKGEVTVTVITRAGTKHVLVEANNEYALSVLRHPVSSINYLRKNLILP